MSAWRRAKPTPGWKPRAEPSVPFVNARAPSVPLSLDLDLVGYYTGCAAIGVISGQGSEPDMKWVSEWSVQQGKLLAAAVRAERKRRERRK